MAGTQKSSSNGYHMQCEIKLKDYEILMILFQLSMSPFHCLCIFYSIYFYFLSAFRFIFLYRPRDFRRTEGGGQRAKDVKRNEFGKKLPGEDSSGIQWKKLRFNINN